MTSFYNTLVNHSTKISCQLFMSSTDSSFSLQKTSKFSVISLGANGTPVSAPLAAPVASTEPKEGKKSNRQLKKEKKRGGEKPVKEKPVWGKAGTGKKKQKQAATASAPLPEFVNTTPKGEKKDMSGEMAAGYRPVAVEAAWQEYWEASGFYRGDAVAAADRPYSEKFVMVIPPPNVTGSLHLGHGLTAAIEDTLTRWHRMRGDATLWVPGTDHAGIATQVVVQKKLMKEEGKSRLDLGREAFVEKVWEWKTQYGNRITQQLRVLGCSVDWDREAFTMDANLSKAVKEAFVRMYDEGLIYRATRLVDWSCTLKSAISDQEVDKMDLEGRTKLAVPGHDPKKKYEFGVMTSFAYKLEDTGEEIVIATTRLETVLGDTGIAVHPDDPRYTHMHGKFALHPFQDRRIPIVLDKILVDMELGTGAVKITPAHDHKDAECGKRHDLDTINILSDDGSINSKGGEFEGMMRFDARVAIEKRMEEMGILRGKVDNKMVLGRCQRTGDIIEPLLRPQWYVNCEDMAKDAVELVENKELEIIPAFHEKTWKTFLNNIRPWCISRQLWWGHRIPAYHIRINLPGREEPSDEDDSYWVAGRDEAEARKRAAERHGVPEEAVILEQDEDVLDTWFSSGLFPFSVFGWPDNTPDMAAFYPTTLLETGHDILFFWVARMVMMGRKLTGLLPFTKVFLHAMVRDKSGRKMSKSLGNVIDPLEVISGCQLNTIVQRVKDGNLPEKEKAQSVKDLTKEYPTGFPECGTDALRFGLLAYTVQGRDVNLDISRVIGYRNFCNKLWNATRFALATVGANFQPSPDLAEKVLAAPELQLRDRWILHRLYECIKACDTQLRAYELGGVVTSLYDFWLHDLCDVYLELIKPIMAVEDSAATPQQAAQKLCAQQTLFLCLEHGLRLLHPLMPFVTEELWQRLPNRAVFRPEPSIMVAPYPVPQELALWRNDEVAAEMEQVQEVTRGARSLRTDYLKPKDRPQMYVRCTGSEELMRRWALDVRTGVKAGELTVLGAAEQLPKGCAVKVVGEHFQVGLGLVGLVDFAAEVAKLEKQLGKLQTPLNALRKKVTAADYEKKTPQDIRDKNAAKIESQSKEEAGLVGLIEQFRALDMEAKK